MQISWGVNTRLSQEGHAAATKALWALFMIKVLVTELQVIVEKYHNYEIKFRKIIIAPFFFLSYIHSTTIKF